MVSKKMANLVEGSSVIRKMFEEGTRLAKLYGPENVYDFSIGNPNVPAPKEVNQAIIDIINEEDSVSVHGYMSSNCGFEEVRKTVAEFLNKTYGLNLEFKNIVMTVGAAGGINVLFKCIINAGDEVIVFAPYFVDYNSYIANHDGKMIVVSPNMETFQPNLEEFEQKITPLTKAVLINTPNNPTGVIYSEETLTKMADILNKKQKEFGTDIYLVSDEPYRELAYDGNVVPYVTKFYDNAIIGYSYSKSLSLPGERIGYLVIPSEISDFENISAAVNIATRILGFINAPSLMQKVVARCIECTTDIEPYNKNRELLYNSLTEYGYECIKPQGAFYMFVKSPIPDEKEFCNEAKKQNILLVPGSSFACPGYIRIAYCVAYDKIKNSLPGFKKLIEAMKSN